MCICCINIFLFVVKEYDLLSRINLGKSVKICLIRFACLGMFNILCFFGSFNFLYQFHKLWISTIFWLKIIFKPFFVGLYDQCLINWHTPFLIEADFVHSAFIRYMVF